MCKKCTFCKYCKQEYFIQEPLNIIQLELAGKSSVKHLLETLMKKSWTSSFKCEHTRQACTNKNAQAHTRTYAPPNNNAYSGGLTSEQG